MPLDPITRHLAALDWLATNGRRYSEDTLLELVAVDDRGFHHRPAGSSATPIQERFAAARDDHWRQRALRTLRRDPQHAARVATAYQLSLQPRR